MTIRFLTLGMGLSLVLGCSTATTTEDTPEEAPAALVSAPGVPTVFNHAYGILTPKTIDAFQKSAFFNQQFVDVEVRTTVRPDLTYTGTYLNGRETYLEYFPEGALGMSLGSTGVGLGDEVTGGLAKVCGKWEKTFGAGEAPITPTTHLIGGVQVPWFDACDLGWTLTSPYVGFWAMEYVPNAGSTAPRTRHEERAARYAPGKLVENVQAIVLALEDGDRANVKKSLASAGWKVVGSPTGSYVALSPLDHGTTRAIAVQPASPSRLGMLGVVFRLNRFAAHTEKLGDATLKVGIAGQRYASLWLVPPVATDDADVAAALAAQ